MEIKVKIDSFIVCIFNALAKLYEGSYFRENVFIQFVELSIEIFATVTSSKIAGYDAIRIEHWHDMKNKHLIQNIR